MAIGDTRLYFAVPAAAIPTLRPWLTEREYDELLRRTPPLGDDASPQSDA